MTQLNGGRSTKIRVTEPSIQKLDCSATFSHLPFQTTKMDENNEEMTPDARLAWLRERVSLRVIEGLKGGTSGKSLEPKLTSL
jgi:hypothetical protein